MVDGGPTRSIIKHGVVSSPVAVGDDAAGLDVDECRRQRGARVRGRRGGRIEQEEIKDRFGEAPRGVDARKQSTGSALGGLGRKPASGVKVCGLPVLLFEKRQERKRLHVIWRNPKPQEIPITGQLINGTEPGLRLRRLRHRGQRRENAGDKSIPYRRADQSYLRA